MNLLVGMFVGNNPSCGAGVTRINHYSVTFTFVSGPKAPRAPTMDEKTGLDRRRRKNMIDPLLVVGLTNLKNRNHAHPPSHPTGPNAPSLDLHSTRLTKSEGILRPQAAGRPEVHDWWIPGRPLKATSWPSGQHLAVETFSLQIAFEAFEAPIISHCLPPAKS